MKLHIVEISPYMYAGAINKHACIEGGVVKGPKGFENQEIPSGGIAFIFNLLLNFNQEDDWVFVADREPTVKREIDPAYKMNRDGGGKRNIREQKDLTELILKDCGFQVYAKDGYEADDLVYSLAYRYKSVYDKVLIYTGDRDLAVAIDDNVEILPCSSQNRHITKENYDRQIDLGMMTPFCTFSYNKMFSGDPKDNIKKLPKAVGDKLFKMFPPHYYEDMGSVRFFGELIKNSIPEAYPTFQLVYPLLTPVEDVEKPKFDLMRIAHWGVMVGNSKFKYNPLIQVAVPSDLIELKKSFFDGSYYSKV